jgi:hypothetical protein
MSGWIGVDLDGTLAEYHGWKGPTHIGVPIAAMQQRVKDWLASGKEVRIFTARACVPEQLGPIKAWCIEHLGQELAITNVKDFGMVELWDDRAVQVKINTGDPVECKPKTKVFTAPALMDGLIEYMKENGIQNWVAIITNPDGDDYICQRKGSALWAIGACQYFGQVITQKQIEDAE